MMKHVKTHNCFKDKKPGFMTRSMPVSGFGSANDALAGSVPAPLPPPPLSRHEHSLPALVLFALLACCALLVPSVAEAQALTIWSATLTVDQRPDGTVRGCDDFTSSDIEFRISKCSAALSDQEFTDGSTTYMVKFLNISLSGNNDVDRLNLRLDSSTSDVIRVYGRLSVGGLNVKFSDSAGFFSTGSRTFWEGALLSNLKAWTKGQTVQVSLSLVLPDNLRPKYDGCFNRTDTTKAGCFANILRWENEAPEITLTDSSKHCPETHARRVATTRGIKCLQSFLYIPLPGSGGGPVAPGDGGGAGGSGGGTVSPGGGGGGSSGGTDPGQPSATCPREDREILGKFYEATGGDEWADNENWNSEEPLGQWFGVGTGEGNVVSLRLADNGLSGDMPRRELLCLSGLKELALWDNDGLSGDIPDELNLAAERAVLRDTAQALSLNAEWFNDYGEPFEFEQWHGGVTTNSDGRVTELDFTGEGIRGEIPGSVFELQRLGEVRLGCGVSLGEEAPEGISVTMPESCEEETADSGDGGCAMGSGDSSVFGLFLLSLFVFGALAGRRARG